jgi:hypothetical protein
MPEFVIGNHAEHIRVEVLRRERPSATDYWDGNWVVGRIDVRIPPWSGTYEALLRSGEFVRFREALESMNRDLTGVATFEPMEPWLELELEVDDLGHISVSGKAAPEGSDRVFGQVGLEFRLSSFLDQTALPNLIAELHQIEAAYPVRGKPSD